MTNTVSTDEQSRARRMVNFAVRAEPAREPTFEGEKTIYVTYNGRQEYNTSLAPHEARKLFDLLGAEFGFQCASTTPKQSRQLTPEALFNFANNFARLSERCNRGTVYPTIKACAHYFRTTQRAIEETVGDYTGTSYMGIISGFRTGSGSGSYKGGERQIEAYMDAAP